MKELGDGTCGSVYEALNMETYEIVRIHTFAIIAIHSCDGIYTYIFSRIWNLLENFHLEQIFSTKH